MTELQISAFCACGNNSVCARGRCRRCYDSARRSQLRFGGHRDEVIRRDGHACVNCLSPRILVHHRNRRLFITLCVRCHPKVHHVGRLRYGHLTPLLERLWREQHPRAPEQLLLPCVLPVPATVPRQEVLPLAA